MDETFRALQNPQDARSTRGILSRGSNIYKGGLPNASPVATNSRTGKKSNDADMWAKLAQMRMKGLI